MLCSLKSRYWDFLCQICKINKQRKNPSSCHSADHSSSWFWWCSFFVQLSYLATEPFPVLSFLLMALLRTSWHCNNLFCLLCVNFMVCFNSELLVGYDLWLLHFFGIFKTHDQQSCISGNTSYSFWHSMVKHNNILIYCRIINKVYKSKACMGELEK